MLSKFDGSGSAVFSSNDQFVSVPLHTVLAKHIGKQCSHLCINGLASEMQSGCF